MQFRQKTLASQCGRISRASSSSSAATTGEASLATGKECSLVSKHHNELLLQVQRSKRVKELRAETRTGETHERLHSASPAGSYHPLVLLLQSDRIGLDSFLFFLQGRHGTIFVDCIKYESAGGARKRKLGPSHQHKRRWNETGVLGGITRSIVSTQAVACCCCCCGYIRASGLEKVSWIL